MKTQSNFNCLRQLLQSALLLLAINGFAQATQKGSVTTLKKVVAEIKKKEASIKNADSLNVMVNDKLVYNLEAFEIDLKKIALVEILVLEPKSGTKVNPSIIINTK